MRGYRDRVPEEYWNHNVHYHPTVLDAVPQGRGAALDVGCGDGLLVRRRAGRARRATGVDRSAAMVPLARERSGHVGNADFVEADVCDAVGGRLPEGGYDFVSAVAVVHHPGFARAVEAMVRLLAPGGRLAVVGLANNRTPLDWVVSGVGVPVARLRARRQGRSGRRAHRRPRHGLG
ncbi:SAM-dependent methyltransferase [Spinactinospora alkalitolerans]|uniref:SAM-dependent methyltransferase n=1 Tax=Spinactinospora alkalitolerans TaxID=687207 RepID=A0A852TSU5_9ACTN|nr:class I SAM-dependent methyltransferase [Spinactinospora alkalitolerans]NYE47089.1 SAM-dependent methyltransferase [Spinactinospora alkalitolerans]